MEITSADSSPRSRCYSDTEQSDVKKAQMRARVKLGQAGKAATFDHAGGVSPIGNKKQLSGSLEDLPEEKEVDEEKGDDARSESESFKRRQRLQKSSVVELEGSDEEAPPIPRSPHWAHPGSPAHSLLLPAISEATEADSGSSNSARSSTIAVIDTDKVDDETTV